MALPLAVDVHINVDQVCARALLEALHHHCNAVRDLIPHKEQCLFADDLCHQLLFRHIGISVVIKVMGAFHGIAAQGIEQLLAALLVAHTDSVDFIKYTQRLQLCLAGFQVGRIFHKVGLVDDRNGRAAAL